MKNTSLIVFSCHIIMNLHLNTIIIIIRSSVTEHASTTEPVSVTEPASTTEPVSVIEPASASEPVSTTEQASTTEPTIEPEETEVVLPTRKSRRQRKGRRVFSYNAVGGAPVLVPADQQ